MEDLFNVLSSSARLKKSKKRRNAPQPTTKPPPSATVDHEQGQKSRDRSGKRDTSEDKLKQIHAEQMAAFRRSMNIRISNKHDTTLPDPIASFTDLNKPKWWPDQASFDRWLRVLLRNIEEGRWKEPTPVQMQAIPSLINRRDVCAQAPTGSGKSGAFILPALLLTNADDAAFYGTTLEHKKQKHRRQGQIRALLLAPSLELSSQLHREVERLGRNLPGGCSTILLSKSNASQVLAGEVGGKDGLDVLVATPLRLVDCLAKGLRLDGVRMVVLDEADRLLDAADGKRDVSGSAQTKTFLAQMDAILAEVPATAVRALFSATVTPTVRSLSESILRNPIDFTIQASSAPGGANPDIEQSLTFVGREQGKLLAIRQLVQRGELRPPVIVFVQSQERAQELFGELLYDGIHVDVIHAGRSKSAREAAVAKFRRGDTWVLICTDLVARGVDFRAVNMVINYDLPESGINYIHRIGRAGRAGRKGQAITLFTEDDFDKLRTIANIMKQSGCAVEDWMLSLPRQQRSKKKAGGAHRPSIDTTPRYDKKKRRRKQQMIEQSKKKVKKDEHH